VAKASRHGDTSKKEQAQEEEASAEAPGDRQKNASEVSALSEDVLDDIDRALKEACGFDKDDIVSDADLEQRADEYLRNYVQKGGQ
jgi:ubiquitin-like protein Pup